MFTKEYFSHYRKTLALALPVCIGQLGHVSVGIVDTLMAGNLGAVPLASATFAFSVFIPFLMFCIGFSFGITPLVANAAGAGDKKGISVILRNSLLINSIFTLSVCLLLVLCTGLLDHLHQPEEILKDGIPFFQVLVTSLLPIQIFQVYKQFAEGLSLTRQAMYISISANIINVLLNYTLIFGAVGLPAFGLMGAAYATLFSRCYMAFAMWLYVNFHKRFKPYCQPFFTNNYSLSSIKRIVIISLPIGLQLILETGAFGFAALMAGWLGTSEIAAHQIALNLAAITYMAASGISAAATIRIGNELGARDFKALITSGRSAYILIIAFEICCTALFIALRFRLPQLYIDNEHIIQLASSLLLITAFFQLSDGMQVVGLGILRGLGDVKIPTGIAIISYWMIGLPLAYIFTFSLDMGVQGIWYGLLIGLSIAAILLFVRFYRKISRMKNKDVF
jgi:MATE family multidrug resistance protein